MVEPVPITPAPTDNGRLDVPLDVRRTALALQAQTNRINGLLGRAWTTKAGIKQSSDELLEVAENALKLRRLLCSL